MDKNEKKLIETLTRGRDSAKRLQNLLRRKADNDGSSSVSAENLIMEVMESFAGCLSVLNSFHCGELYRVPASLRVDLPCSDNRIPESFSGEAQKNQPPGVTQLRRGCYKRRTIDSRVKTSSTIQDDYAWRKYGQKEILNSKYPRCYFRCTHKHVLLGCKALKQVQKLEDESNMFHITYIGHHTCSPSNTSSHPGAFIDRTDSKIYHNLPNSPSTITNAHIDPWLGQVMSSDSSPNDTQSYALVWKEIMINDLESFKNYGILSDIPFSDVFLS